jgi:hypothetical protein
MELAHRCRGVCFGGIGYDSSAAADFHFPVKHDVASLFVCFRPPISLTHMQ